MPKIVIASGMVLNLGGYVLERKAKLPCIDVVVGNPLPEDIKVNAPIYSQEMLNDIQKQGLIVEYVQEGDLLKDRLDAVKKMVDDAKAKRG
jgi:hypothetical protein